MSYDAGALVFMIQSAGRQVFESDMAAVDRASAKAGTSADTASKQVTGLGTAADDAGKKSKSAKAPLEEQARTTKKVGDESETAARKQKEQAASSAEQAAAAKELAKTLTVAGAAASAMVTLSVARFAQFDEAMSLTRAATMATTREQEALREAALEAGADTAFSATEAANAQEELAKAGLSVADIVGGSLNGALSLAAAGQLEVARSAEIMATTLTQFRLPAEDAAHVSDLLAAGAGKAMGSVEDLANGLKFVGPVAASMGLSLEETVGVLALFADQGIIGEQAGTSFRGMLSSLTSPSQLAARTLQQYNVQLFDGNGKMKSAAAIAAQLNTAFNGLSDAERSAALGRIFGNEQITAATVLMRAGAKGVDEYTAAVNDSGYAAEQAAMKQDNLAGDIEKLGGAFETALIRTGAPANNTLRDMVQIVTGLVDVYGELPEPVHQGALVFGVAAGAIGLFSAAAVTGRAKLLELKTSFDTTNVSMRRTALVGAGAGLALTGVLTVVGLLAARHAEATARAEAYADALERGGNDARDLATEALTAEQSFLWMSRGSAADAAEKFGISLERLGDAALGDADALAEMNDVLAAGQGDTAAAERLAAQHGLTLLEVSSASTLLAETLENEAGAKQKGAEIQRQANEITAEGADVTQTAAEAYLDAASGAKDLERQLSTLLDTMLEANGVGQDAVTSNINYLNVVADVEETIAKAREGAEGYALTLDQGTQAGRDNLDMLVGMASKSQAAAQAQFELGQNTESLQQRLAEGRQTLIDRATDLGYTADEAARLADEIYNIPPEREFEIIANTTAAEQAIARLTAIKSVPIIAEFVGAPAVGAGTVLREADGGVVKYFANGGVEHHVAQMARAGAVRVWAEPETGGESYVPHAPSKRARSEQIMAQTAELFGGRYIPASAVGYADGGTTAALGGDASAVAGAREVRDITIQANGLSVEEARSLIREELRNYYG